MTPAIPVSRLRPWDKDRAMELARAEYERYLALVASLGPSDWSKPTDCEGWDVKDITSHLTGMARLIASPVRMAATFARAEVVARRHRTHSLHVVNGWHVDERRGQAPERVMADLRPAFAAALGARVRCPRMLRVLPAPTPLGTVRIGTLNDITYTRDVWMHRVDVSRATGRAMELSQEHDGAIVGDVVRDWADAHGAPFTLELTGPGGGVFTQGSGGDRLTLEPVEFCRVVSGRAPGEGLLAQKVLF